ncbi:hypothetical protein ACSTJG_24065, partial [Vibrio parahaemolyticus]
EQWDRIDDVEAKLPVDGGDGQASVVLDEADAETLTAFATRTRSHPDEDPMTGADLGAGPGAGKITGDDLGGADNITIAAEEARSAAV